MRKDSVEATRFDPGRDSRSCTTHHSAPTVRGTRPRGGTVCGPGHPADRRSPPALSDRCGCHHVAQWDIFFQSRHPRSLWRISGCDDEVNREAQLGSKSRE